MEDLSGEVSHVAVEEDEEGLDDSHVQGEARRKGTQEPVDESHQDASQRHHEEADHTEQGVAHSHGPRVRKLLKQVIQNLHTD